MNRISKLIYIFLLFALFACSEKEYPIWLSEKAWAYIGIRKPVLQKNSLNQKLFVSKYINYPPEFLKNNTVAYWEPNNKDEYPFELYKYNPETGMVEGKMKQARTCNDFITLTEDKYSAHAPDYEKQIAWYLDCKSIQLLKAAKPAKISYIHDFTIDKNTILELPQSRYFILESPPSGIVMEAPYSAEVEDSTGSGVRYNIFGKADINHDGIEDMIVKQVVWFERGTNSRALHILTRLTPDGELVTIDEFIH